MSSEEAISNVGLRCANPTYAAGLGFTYCLRSGAPAQFAHASEIAPELVGEDPSDISRLWSKMVWAGASVGRSGVATQAIAAFDTSAPKGSESFLNLK